MIKIWAKVIKEDKIIKQTVLQKDEQLDYGNIPAYVYEICEGLDLPSPVILKTHIFNYAKYNYVKFTKADYVEEINFDKFIIENTNR